MLYSLSDYLKQNEFLNYFPLEQSSRLFFHWADADFSCEQVLAGFKENKIIGSDFQRLRLRSHELKKIHLWIRADNQTRAVTLWQLYEGLLLKQAGKSVLPFNLPDIFEASTLGPGGPFRIASAYEFLNLDIYRLMALEKVMNGELPKRDFRLRCESEILCYYGEGLKHSFPVQLCQVTLKGLLLKIESDYWERAKLGSHLGLLLEINPFILGIKLELKELFKHLSNHALSPFFTHDQKKMCLIEITSVKDFVGHGAWERQATEFNKKSPHYLFVPYRSISSPANEVAEVLSLFTQNLREELIKKAG